MNWRPYMFLLSTLLLGSVVMRAYQFVAGDVAEPFGLVEYAIVVVALAVGAFLSAWWIE